MMIRISAPGINTPMRLVSQAGILAARKQRCQSRIRAGGAGQGGCLQRGYVHGEPADAHVADRVAAGEVQLAQLSEAGSACEARGGRNLPGRSAG